MRTGCFTALAIGALFLGGVHAEARTITCPPPASGVFHFGEISRPLPYEGPLVSVEMRTETTGDRIGEATIYCARSVGAVRIPGGNCRLTPGAGGRITAKADANAETVTCTLLGTSGTNDTACFVACD